MSEYDAPSLAGTVTGALTTPESRSRSLSV